MIDEVEKHIPRIAETAGVPMAQVSEVWAEYRSYIHFEDVGGPSPDQHLRDPNDAPYVRLGHQLETVILSRDLDLPAMGAIAEDMVFVENLRDYGRARSTQVTIMVAGEAALTVGVEAMLRVAGLLAPSLKRGIRNVPATVWVILGAALGAALLHGPTRKLLGARFRTVQDSAGSAVTKFFTVLSPVFEEYRKSRSAADEFETKIKASLTNHRQLESTRPLGL